jgi:hypothetical protein
VEAHAEEEEEEQRVVRRPSLYVDP